MTTSESKLAAVVDKLRSLPYETLKLHALSVTLPAQIKRASLAGYVHIAGTSSNRAFNTDTPYSPEIDAPLTSGLTGPVIENHTRLTSIKAILEATPEYHDACATVQPLYEQMLSLQAQVEAEHLAIQQAQSDLSSAVRRAEERALEKAASDSEIARARKALEAAGK